MADRIETRKTVIDTPIGPVVLTLRGGCVVDVSFRAGGRARGSLNNPAIREAHRTLRRYFRNSRTRLSLPLAPAGTPFQQRVWRALRRIPPGQVRRYGELARTLGTSARAVGGACRANPIPILIPCHRVVSSSGEGGFMGKTSGRAMAVKRWLLRHERGD